VGLIHDDVLPPEFVQSRQADPAPLKGRDAHIKFIGQHLVLDDFFSVFFSSDEVHYFDLRRPLLELIDPVGDGGFWHYDQEVPIHMLVLPQEAY